MIEHNGISWSIYHRMLIPRVAPHVDVGLDQQSAIQLLVSNKALLIRWVSEFDRQSPSQWWYVIKDGKVSLEELSRNSRHDVRRGLKKCYVAKLNADFIANNGYPVYKKAYARYQTRGKPLREMQFMESYLLNPHKDLADYWGVFDRNSKKMIGYCKNRYSNNTCEYITGQFDPEYLSYYPGLVLIFEMSHYYLNELGALYVSDGQRSISHDTNIQEFLIHKLKFRKAYCRLNIVYSPFMKAVVNLLYPFRSVLPLLNKEIFAVLKQEEIRRSFK